MSSRWFRVPETSTAVGPAPDLKDHAVDGWAGNAAHPDGPPQFVVRVYADTETLDALAAESGVTELSTVSVQALNQMLEQARDKAEWNNGFAIGQ